jgi:hypothetical protein
MKRRRLIFSFSFLEQSQQEVSISLSEGLTIPSYDTELNILTEMIQQTAGMLLKDPDNLVRQTLLEHGITRLCVFFGKQRGMQQLIFIKWYIYFAAN